MILGERPLRPLAPPDSSTRLGAGSRVFASSGLLIIDHRRERRARYGAIAVPAPRSGGEIAELDHPFSSGIRAATVLASRAPIGDWSLLIREFAARVEHRRFSRYLGTSRRRSAAGRGRSRMELDRRSLIAALGGAATVATMSHEARADALE